MYTTDDLCSELDCLSLDEGAARHFGATDFDASETLAQKRRLAVEQWLIPHLESAGYNPRRHLTHKAPDRAWSEVSGTFVDRTAALSDNTDDDLDLNDVLVTSTDYLYLCAHEPPRGVLVGMLDQVNVNTLTTLTVQYWTGGSWQAVSSLTDGTRVATSISLSGGGRLSWARPTDWRPRTLNPTVDPARYYVLRLSTNRQPSDTTTVGQVLPIRASRLMSPVAYRALAMLYEEGHIVGRGDWDEKADRFYQRADQALTLALPNIRDEFDVDDSGAVGRDEVNSVIPPRGPFILERG